MEFGVEVGANEEAHMVMDHRDLGLSDTRDDETRTVALALHDMEVPATLSYSEMHMWIDVDEEPFTLGMTAYGVATLDPIEEITLPEVGLDVVAGDEIGTLQGKGGETAIICPVDGTILHVNAAVLEDPQVISDDPYEEGWLVKIEPTDDEPDLLDAEEYTDLISETQDL